MRLVNRGEWLGIKAHIKERQFNNKYSTNVTSRSISVILAEKKRVYFLIRLVNRFICCDKAVDKQIVPSSTSVLKQAASETEERIIILYTA